MQWDGTRGAGFSRADPGAFVAPLVEDCPFSCKRVNVTDERLDPNSLLTWFERTLHALRECEEIGIGDHEILDVGPDHVLVHRATGRTGRTLIRPQSGRPALPPEARGRARPGAAPAELRRRLRLR